MYLNLKRDCSLTGEGLPLRVSTEAHSGWSNGWMARLSSNPRVSYRIKADRVFLSPDSTRLSRAGNGSKEYTLQDSGIYEADSVWRSFKSHRAWIRIRDGEVEVTQNENVVAEWLKETDQVGSLRAQIEEHLQSLEALQLKLKEAESGGGR